MAKVILLYPNSVLILFDLKQATASCTINMSTTWSQKALFAPLPRVNRATPVVISGDPNRNNFLYTNGSCVFIRNTDNPEISDVYTDHKGEATVAKYSPSGQYIASADKSGYIHIWDAISKEDNRCFQPMAGEIYDLAWSQDSQRLAVVGERGNGYNLGFGCVLNIDETKPVFDIMGHSKTINSVDIPNDRPFRVVTGSDDTKINLFERAVVRHLKTISDHTRYVNCVRFSPTGNIFISAGSDGQSNIYNGLTGERIWVLGEDRAHTNSINGLCFNDDGSKVLTVSSDKTAKIWDVETTDVVAEFVMGSSMKDIQVGCLWQGDNILTVSASGFINYLDRNNPDKPIRIIKGHKENITAMTLTENKAFTGCIRGRICYWDLTSGDHDQFSSAGHSSTVTDICIDGDTLVSCGNDNFVIFSTLSSNQYGTKVEMPSVPLAMCYTTDGRIVVACRSHIVLLKNKAIWCAASVESDQTSIDIRPGETEVAVGGKQRLVIYTLANDTLTESRVITSPDNDDVGAAKYSPDGAFLAYTSGSRIFLLALPDYAPTSTNGYGYHHVSSLAWTPDSRYLISGDTASNLVRWDRTSMAAPTIIRNTHPKHGICKVGCIGDVSVSVGNDCCLKQWTFTEC